MFRKYARSRRSLRIARTTLGLPVHELSADEVDASIRSFIVLARISGLPSEDLAAALHGIRAAVMAARPGRYGNGEQPDAPSGSGQLESRATVRSEHHDTAAS